MEPPHQRAGKASLLVLAYSAHNMSHKRAQYKSTMQQGLVNSQCPQPKHSVSEAGCCDKKVMTCTLFTTTMHGQRTACVQGQKDAKWLSPEGPIMTSLETKASLTELLPCQVSVLVDSKLHNTRLLSTVDTSCYMHQRLRTQSCSYLVGVIFRVMLPSLSGTLADE